MENVLPPNNSVFHKVLTRPQSSLIISIRRGRLERARAHNPSASLVNN